VQKSSKKKAKPRRKRFVVEATLGPLEVAKGMFTPGTWYVIDDFGGWALAETRVPSDDVMSAADERALDKLAENVMDVWEEMHPGRRWAFHVSTVVRERQTGELRRKP
jgi:hypothetical protein